MNSSIPTIAVSSCLLGEEVRYDGKSKGQSFFQRLGNDDLNIISVCPEANAGMSIPRPPMNLYQIDGQVKALLREAKTDQTDVLTQFAKQTIDSFAADKISGVILKSKSPSCGTDTTPIYDLKDNVLRTKSGLFSQTLQDHTYYFPIEDENGLKDFQRREQFLFQVFQYHCLNQQFTESKQDILLSFLLRSEMNLLNELFAPNKFKLEALLTQFNQTIALKWLKALRYKSTNYNGIEIVHRLLNNSVVEKNFLSLAKEIDNYLEKKETLTASLQNVEKYQEDYPYLTSRLIPYSIDLLKI